MLRADGIPLYNFGAVVDDSVVEPVFFRVTVR